MLKAVLNMLLVKRLGIAGITLSTSLVTLFNAVLLGILISKQIKMDYRSLFKNFCKMIVAGSVTLVICLGLRFMMDKIQMQAQLLEILKICTVGFLCIIIYIGLNLLFRNEYVLELKNRLVKAKK